MSNRVSALSNILRSPARILAIVLVVVFLVEVAVMFVLPYLVPSFLGEAGRALLDAMLLTAVCSPALWWIIIGPLRRIAIQEHLRSQTIVSNASEGILSFDQDAVIVSCNRAGSDLFDAAVDELVGKSIQAAIPDLPEVFHSLPSEYLMTGVRTDGTSFPVHVAISEYPSETHPLHIAIIRDLTDAQEAEEHRITAARQAEALRAQQMAILAQLATGVAHEIRNPLTSIKMLIQINRAKFAEKGLPTDDMELVEQEIRRMERSVNSLLEFARPEKADFRRFTLQDAVQRSLDLIAGRCDSQNVKLHSRLPEHPIRVVGDLDQIQQLLLNLALNGLDAMPDGGDLTVAVEDGEDRVEVVVSDTGIGISENVLDSLFAPFVTTKANGVGLGLGICRRIAEAHHGSIVGVNQSSGGASFRLSLPHAQASETQGEHFGVERN